MSGLARFTVHDVDLLEPAVVTDRYGDTVADWSQPPASTTSVKGWFTRVDTDEMAEGREAITDIYELSVEVEVPLLDTSRVVRLGETYEVRGSVKRAEAPGGTHHLICRVRRVAG